MRLALPGHRGNLVAMTILDQLQRFLAGRERSAWLEDDVFSLYVRQANRLVEGEIRPVLDLANCHFQHESLGPEPSGTGVLRPIFLAMEAQTKYDFLFAECVHSPRARAILEKNGWTRIPDTHDIHYYKRLR